MRPSRGSREPFEEASGADRRERSARPEGHQPGYGRSGALRQKMQQAGVADRPDFYFLEEVEHRQE